MNDIERISTPELNELESMLGRFDSFKHDLTPNPDALRAALTRMSPTAPAHFKNRRKIRISGMIAIVCASVFAFALLLRPQPSTLSPLASDMLAEEQTINASFAVSSDADGDVDSSLNDADATLASLTDDSVL